MVVPRIAAHIAQEFAHHLAQQPSEALKATWRCEARQQDTDTVTIRPHTMADIQRALPQRVWRPEWQ
jgi:hypothetical protein